MENMTINLGTNKKPYELDVSYSGGCVEEGYFYDTSNLKIHLINDMNGISFVPECLTDKFLNEIIEKLCCELSN